MRIRTPGYTVKYEDSVWMKICSERGRIVCG